jgi:hypothetical protein
MHDDHASTTSVSQRTLKFRESRWGLKRWDDPRRDQTLELVHILGPFLNPVDAFPTVGLVAVFNAQDQEAALRVRECDDRLQGARELVAAYVLGFESPGFIELE